MNRQLQELADIHYGKSPASIRAESSDIPIYAASGQVGWATQALFDGPLTVVARKGTLDNPTYSAGPCWVIDTAYAVIPKQNVDGKWLYYALSSFNLGSLNEATGVPSINRDYLYRIAINTPDYPEQRKIARILSTVDDLIERTEALIAKHRAIKQGLMHDLLTRGVDASGRLRPPREEAPGLYRESAVGWVPRGWEVARVSEEFEITTGIALGPHRHVQSGGHPYLRVANVLRERIVLDDVAELAASRKELAERILKENDLLIVEGHANPNEIGRCALVPSKARGLTFQNHLFRLRAYRIDPSFALAWLNGEWTRVYWHRLCGTSSGLNTINRSMLQKLGVPVPTSEEQERIVNRIRVMNDRIRFELESQHKVIAIKAGLMQDLLTGRVRCLDRGGAK